MEPNFRAGGLASGLDTTGLVDKLIAAESRPLQLLTKRQASFSVQISSLGQLMSQLGDLRSVAASLRTEGISVIKPNGTNSDFSISGSADNVGRYTFNVDTLARSAKVRLQSFTSTTDAAVVPDDTLSIALDGGTAVAINTAGLGLSELASEINRQVTGVTASVVSDGTSYHLSITRKETGYTGADPSTALSVTVGDPAAWSQGTWTTTPATNAKLFVDGLAITRRSNEISDVIPGATLSLKAASKTDMDVVFERDSGASKANLQKLVDAYNKSAKFLTSQLRPTAASANGATSNNSEERLGGSTIINLQGRLRKVVSTEIHTTGSIRTLGDLGVKLTKEGTLELDGAKLDAALAKDPQAVDKMFTTGTTGLSAVLDTIAKDYTNGIDGILHNKQKELQKSVTEIDKSKARFQAMLERRKDQLLKQFTAMERLVNQFTSIGQYLDNQTAQQTKR